MPILDQLREVMAAKQALTRLQMGLVDQAIEAGVTWQELAFIDKLSAYKLVMQKTHCQLLKAREVVDNFLTSNLPSE